MNPLTYVTTEDCQFCKHGRGVHDTLGIPRHESVIEDNAEDVG